MVVGVGVGKNVGKAFGEIEGNGVGDGVGDNVGEDVGEGEGEGGRGRGRGRKIRPSKKSKPVLLSHHVHNTKNQQVFRKFRMSITHRNSTSEEIDYRCKCPLLGRAATKHIRTPGKHGVDVWLL